MLDIYVGNLPERANTAELRELFVDVAGQKPLVSFLSAFLSNYRNVPVNEALKFTMVETGHGVRYCRISGNSHSAAKKMIGKLSGAGLHGQVLEVRPFYPRKIANDRRRAGWHFRRWLGVERRANERRDEP